MKVTEPADPEEWPEPEEQAADYRSFHEGDGEGVLIDALVDARIEARDHQHHLEKMGVNLDYLADSHSLGARHLDEYRKMQQHIYAIAEWMEEFANAINDELDDIRSQ